jgi:monoamine oxidase
MMQPVVIIGGGLAGLIAARGLHRSGVAFHLIEARARLGGRILTVDGFDLGPSWFWPTMQPDFAAHVREIGAETFAQWESGDLLFQREQGPAQRFPGLQQEPSSVRLTGGMAALTARLAAELPDRCIRLNTRATALTLSPEGVTVGIEDGSDLIASHVLMALPPRLATSSIAFDPPLPPRILHLWRSTPTWMAPHAKVVAIYDRPFWRAADLSGAARSQVGPLVEIHDATTADGRPALFGFVGIPAQERARAGQAALIGAAMRQLELLFGAAAAEPATTHYKDWAADPLTATPLDLIDE